MVGSKKKKKKKKKRKETCTFRSGGVKINPLRRTAPPDPPPAHRHTVGSLSRDALP